VQYSINVGGVADVPEFEFKVEIFLNTFDLQKKSRAIGKVINNSADSG